MIHHQKQIFLIFSIMVISFGIKAQGKTSSSTFLDKTIFSLRFVKAFSTVNNDKQSSNINNLYSKGFQAKLLYLISEKFAVAVEPIIHNKGYTNGSNKVNITYLDIPLNIERIKFRPFITPEDFFTIGLGFYGGYAISGKNVNGYNNTTQNVKFGDAKTDECTRLDYGINFSTTLALATFIEFGFNAQLGINNVTPKDLQINGNKTTLTSMGLFIGVNTNIFKMFKK